MSYAYAYSLIMSMRMRTDNLAAIRGRIAEMGVRQVDLAELLGIHPAQLSAILNGHRPPPEGFVERVNATLDRLEVAEKAAQEARARVLAGGGAEANG